MEEELEIGEEELATGESEAPGRQEELPPLLDQPTRAPPPPTAAGSSLAQGHATPALIRNKRGRVPASRKAIQGLRKVTAPLTDDCCAICLRDFDSSPRLRAMPCSHTFHEHCIFEWLRRNAACPLCRHQLPTEEEVDEEDQRSRVTTRLLYDPSDGRYHVLWCMTLR
ncbi:hypothetical protein HU200_038693 [Digitaria exilis]|uniref:RING-type domain-containing protein n=1 Tax=Digitaria exilis TaxID=1010633 RepID=A0A835BAJ9_9POAL|nr:hypothetical protein HU200_038693 [Digitaria exilis]